MWCVIYKTEKYYELNASGWSQMPGFCLTVCVNPDDWGRPGYECGFEFYYAKTREELIAIIEKSFK